MSKIIVSDTSCLILLDKLNLLHLLYDLFGDILITSEIEKEFGTKLPSWIKTLKVKDTAYQKVLESNIDKGEASAIALALEMDNCLLIIDDNKARKLARHLELTYIGTTRIIG